MTDEVKSPERHSDAPAEVPAAVAPGDESVRPAASAPARSGARLRSILVSGLVGATIIAGIMALQSSRHGWPFSLHHGYVEVAGRVQRAPSPSHSAGAPAEQPRAPVTLASSRASEFGIRVERVRSEPMARSIRAVATVAPDESRVSEIHTRVSGWIEELYANKTGQAVRTGQALAAIFSPDLMAAQNELFALKKTAATGTSSPLLEGARSRLRVLGMTDAQIASLESRGQPTRLVTIASPRHGVIIRRSVAVGTSVDPSTELMTVADLSKIWVLAEIPERDVPDVPAGSRAELEFEAAGGGGLEAEVAFVYPTLTERTRTLRVRFELDNPGERLKPGMYGNATFHTGARRALTVRRDAVVDTGLERHVFVVEQPGHYVPRKVEVGVELGDRVEIRSGLMENENVVASGVFLIDSESRLRASGGGAMAGMQMEGMDMDPGMEMDAGSEPMKPAPPSQPKAAPRAHEQDHRTPTPTPQAPPAPPKASHDMGNMPMPSDAPNPHAGHDPHAGHGE